MAELIGDYTGMDTADKDFPANTSTPGLVETGWKDYGVISQAGDVDWFKVNVTGGQQYRFSIEANSTFNGLFDPQLSIYDANGALVATAVTGQGFQSKYIDITPAASTSLFLAASGPDTLTGNYILTVPIGTTAASSGGGTSNPGTITGNTGNDVLTATSGNDAIDGAGGIDTVRYTGPAANFLITRTSNGATVQDNTGAEGTDTLVNVERLQFADKSIALDIAGNGGQAYRVYQAAFDRKPDSSGVGYWISKMDAGAALVDVAGGFLESAEFKALYGSNPTVSEYVSRLYQNVLHRAGEQAGVDYWTNALNTGAQSKAQVLAGFSESTENQAAVIGAIQNGFEYTSWS